MGYIEEFKEYLYDNCKSEKTVQAYIKDVSQFVKFYDKSLSEITNEDIISYKDYMINKQKLSIKTVNRKLVSINQFLTYLQIAVTIRQEKVHTQNFLNNIFSDNDVERMIQCAEENNDIRAKALIVTMKMTGMRISEVLQLNVQDINKDTIMIIGKGNKRRNVFVAKNLKKIWYEYSQVRINKTDKLFTGQKGGINRHTAHKIIKKYGNMARVDFKKSHCHNFRHHYCRALAKRGLSIDVIADIVGHTDINVTKVYTRKTQEELLEIVNDI